LLLHLVVSEDAWRLFGFATDAERSLFRTCLKVSGVGPATALALLSGMGARDLQAAVASGDVKALTRVKGIGKKTAERLVVELRDALAVPGGVASGGAIAGGGPVADAHAALVALGLDPSEAAERLRRIPDAATLDVPALVRRALRST
jgi:Holliday junction DNA helicase RuvA